MRHRLVRRGIPAAVSRRSAWFTARAGDGDAVEANDVVCTVTGPAAPILTGERASLNFLQLLSGTATSRDVVTHARSMAAARAMLDTRKTLPGLRGAQKYAVRCGGCHNHRLGIIRCHPHQRQPHRQCRFHRARWWPRLRRDNPDLSGRGGGRDDLTQLGEASERLAPTL